MIPNPNIFICPVCGDPLTPHPKSYICTQNHTFDIAKQGYVNLLLCNQKKSLQPGDNKEMVQSRFAFLKQDYYAPIVEQLHQAITQKIADITSSTVHIADIGCGVGYYLSALKKQLVPSYPQLQYSGIDISKDAIQCASQQDKTITWFVASALQLPYRSESIDILISVFSPLYMEEIQRVLAQTGLLFVISPSENHLIELRTTLYDEIKEMNTEKLLQKTENFLELIETIPIRSLLQLPSQEAIENLLKMTPFYWRASAVKKAELLSLSSLTVTLDVTLQIFKKR